MPKLSKYETMSNAELRRLVLEAAIAMDEPPVGCVSWFCISNVPDKRELAFSTELNWFFRSLGFMMCNAVEWYIMPFPDCQRKTMMKCISRCFLGKDSEEFITEWADIAAFTNALCGEKTLPKTLPKRETESVGNQLEKLRRKFLALNYDKLFNSKIDAINPKNKAKKQKKSEEIPEGKLLKNGTFPQAEKEGKPYENGMFPPKVGEGETRIITNKILNNNLPTTTTLAISKELESVVGWLNENGKKHNEHDLQQLEEYLQAGFTLEAILYRLKYSLQNARTDFWKLLYKILQEDKAKQLFTPEAMQQSDRAHSQRVNRGEAAAAGGYIQASDIYVPSDTWEKETDIPETIGDTSWEAIINSAYWKIDKTKKATPAMLREAIKATCETHGVSYTSEDLQLLEEGLKAKLESEGK